MKERKAPYHNKLQCIVLRQVQLGVQLGKLLRMEDRNDWPMVAGLI